MWTWNKNRLNFEVIKIQEKLQGNLMKLPESIENDKIIDVKINQYFFSKK